MENIAISISGSDNKIRDLLQQINTFNLNTTNKIEVNNNEHEHECAYCHKSVDINDLNEMQKNQFFTTHLCKECQAIIAQAALILTSKTNNIQVSKIERPTNIKTMPHQNIVKSLGFSCLNSTQQNDKPKKISAGKQCRDIIFAAIPNMTYEHLAMFTDEAKSKQLFGILYPLFVKITGMNNIQIDNARKCRGFYRYFAKRYHILNDDYLMCNDLYERHIAQFNNAFVELNLIVGEKINTSTKTNKYNNEYLDIDAQLSSSDIISYNQNVEEVKQYTSRKDIIDIIAFNPSNNESMKTIQHKKKTPEELLTDIRIIEKTQEQAKHDRLSKLKAKFNFSTKHLPKKNEYKAKTNGLDSI